MERFLRDRDYIENKFHKKSEPFDPYQRMAYHGYDFDPSTGLDDTGLSEGLLRLETEITDLPHPVAKALVVKYVLEHTRIDVNEHDMFVGFYSVNRWPNRITINRWNEEILADMPDVKAVMRDLNDSGAVGMWPDFDHVVPDWDAVLRLGFAGLRDRAVKYKAMHQKNGTLDEEKRAVFDGIAITYGAVLDILERFYQLAKARNTDRTNMVAQCLAHIRDGAPQNIYEAMQTIFIYFMVSECFDCYQVRSLGNGLDQTLYRFYQSDLESGTFTRAEIKELLAYFFMQWSAIGNYWGQPFYMGGTDEQGNTKYNDLSFAILEVYDEIGIYNPKIQLKINRNTPEPLLYKVFDMVRRGKSCFVFCCEPGMMKAVMSYGASYEEAREMDIRGCYETGVRAAEVSTATGYINALKPVEYVFSNGFDTILQKQFGVQTGEPEQLTTFDDFYHAVLKQWEYLIELSIQTSCAFEPYLGYMNPSNMYTATIEGSLKAGRDAYQNGVKFNNSALLNCGFASLVDAVMAVKEFVYDKKMLRLTDMKTALERNWAGYEEIHTKICKSRHKYGNGDPQADMYAEAMAAFFAMKVNQRPNARGGVYKAIMHSAMMFVWQGEKTGATPDGRYAGDEISKNASPSVGMDKNGVTALINSAVRLRPYTYPESFCLDVMLHPSAVSGAEGLAVMKALLFTYMDNGGMSMQMNVFDAETLRDAQKHPEKYQNLQVRVCGWNVLWNHLSKAEQDAYILRAETI